MNARLIALLCCLVIASAAAWYIYSSHQRQAQPLVKSSPQTPRIVAVQPSQFAPSVQAPTTPSTPATIATTSVSSTPLVTSAKHPGTKLYSNEEYGFEFWYPETWSTFIHEHGLGASSVFEMVAAPNKNETYLDPLLVK
jgi:hypothetical protein